MRARCFPNAETIGFIATATVTISLHHLLYRPSSYDDDDDADTNLRHAARVLRVPLLAVCFYLALQRLL